MPGITSLNDPVRMQALADAGLEDIRADDFFDAVTRLASRLLDIPTALVSIVDSERQYFPGAYGLAGERGESRFTPLSHSYCRHVVESGLPLVVGDARSHPVTKGNPAITDYGALAYAGYPIITVGGVTIGTVCAVDSQPRNWSAADLAVLQDLAHLASLVVDSRVAKRSRWGATVGGDSGTVRPTEWRRGSMESEFLQGIFENGAIGLLVLDTNGGIIHGNCALEQLVGRTCNEIIGSPLTELVHPDDRARSGDAFRRFVAGDVRSYPHDERCMRPDGRLIWCRVTATLIRGQNGRPAYALLLKQDITAEKTTPSDASGNGAGKARAERLRALGELATGVAHDFNNALSVITACTGMVLSQLPEDAKVRMDLHDIEVAARKAADLSQQLLRFARGQSGPRVPLDVAAVVAEMKGSLLKSVTAGIVVESQLDSSAPMILADKVSLQQILLNLVVNARDAISDNGRITIAVRGGDGETVLQVSDTGTGIPPEIRDRLFEPFFTTKGEGKGTGLGLATVQRIAVELGGKIAVESELGRGTTFTLSFPSVGSLA